MKQKLISLLLCGLLFVTPAAAAPSMNFSDVSSNDWFYLYVSDLYSSGVINGITSTSFQPSGTVTLGQALKMILLAADYKEQSPTTDHWASGYYRLAAQKGFLPDDTSLTLDDPISRLSIAQIIGRTLNLSRTGTDTPFTDTTDKTVLALYDHGIFTGSVENGRTYFKPDSSIKRSEISAVIWRMYQLADAPTEEEPADPPAQDPEQPPKEEGEYFYWGGEKVYIVDELAPNTYDNDLFVKNEQGFLTYNSADYTCKVGIDVSRYQYNIDWKAVKDAGVDFALIRLGYRGYGAAGNMVLDNYFQKNIQEAQANGIEVGVYFFSQAITPAEAVAEAQFCFDALKGYHITYPIVYDWEPYPDSYDARTEGLDDDTLTQCTVAFCEAVKAAGYQPMVYSNLTYFYLHLDLSKLVDYPFWLAQYNNRPTFRYHFDIWQYSCTGVVPGIEGDVDLNIQFIPKK